MERVAVITGASQGLGFELARSLAADGWSLVIDARRADLLDRAHAAIEAAAVWPTAAAIINAVRPRLSRSSR